MRNARVSSADPNSCFLANYCWAQEFWTDLLHSHFASAILKITQQNQRNCHPERSGSESKDLFTIIVDFVNYS
jgi:hypothetical protein